MYFINNTNRKPINYVDTVRLFLLWAFLINIWAWYRDKRTYINWLIELECFIFPFAPPTDLRYLTPVRLIGDSIYLTENLHNSLSFLDADEKISMEMAVDVLDNFTAKLVSSLKQACGCVRYFWVEKVEA